MKTNAIDYILSSLLMTLIGALSWLLAWGASKITVVYAGDYHVLIDLAIALAGYGIISAVVVRSLFRFFPIPSGTYSMDSKIFTTWKLITVLYHFGQTALRPLTPIFLKPAVAALYGARMGKEVALGGLLDAPFMISVGDRAVIGAFSLVSANFTSGDSLIFGDVKIGQGATIGVNAVVYPNTEIGDGAVLLGGSYLMPGSKIPPGETWRGNPARKWM